MALCRYDAVHRAAQLDAPDLAATGGDRSMLTAWRELGLSTLDPAG